MERDAEPAIPVARTVRRRLRGLAGRDRAEAAAGLLIPRCRSVHTFGMRFALDLVWLDANGAVVRVDRDVPPRRVRACRRARAVVELPAGGPGRYRPASRSSAG